MISFSRALGLFFILVLLYTPLSGQIISSQNSVDLLKTGIDIRNIDKFNLVEPSTISGTHQKIFNKVEKKINKLNYKDNSTLAFVHSAKDFEKTLLKSDTTDNLFLSHNSFIFSERILKSTSKPVIVYSIQTVKTRKEVLNQESLVLDSLFIDSVDRLLSDITIPGFVHQFGTHFYTEITYGGYLMNRFIIENDEFIYSPYDESAFKEKVAEFAKAYKENQDFSDPFLNVNTISNFKQGGDSGSLTYSSWLKTLEKNVAPVNFIKKRISRLLTEKYFPKDTLIHRKREAMDFYINFIEQDLRKQLAKPKSIDFFKKFSIPFKLRVNSILKVSSGNEAENTSIYKGDLFYGAFVDDQTLLQSSRIVKKDKEVDLDHLITDERVMIDDHIEFIVPHEYFDRGFANVWDESQKLIKGVGRTNLVVNGEEGNRIYIKKALRNKVIKNVKITTIDNDEYEIEFSLEHIDVSNELDQLKSFQNHAMQSELIAAASNGNIETLQEYHKNKVNINVDGIVKAAITTIQPVVFFNKLFDMGVKPSQNDLDYLFDPDYYNKDVALILLERGAIPKNNMVFKAVAFRSPNVVRALLREGAVPANNDLDYAIKLQDKELVSALTGKNVVDFKNNQIVYKEDDKLFKPSKIEETYIVKKGDYLGKIARFYNVSIKEIIDWNKLSTNTIFVNQKLKLIIDNPEFDKAINSIQNEGLALEKIINYKVNKGDFLGSIAQKHNVTVSELKKINNLNSDKIYVGQNLKILSQVFTQGNTASQLTKNKITPNLALQNGEDSNIPISFNEQKTTSDVLIDSQKVNDPVSNLTLNTKNSNLRIDKKPQTEINTKNETSEKFKIVDKQNKISSTTKLSEKIVIDKNQSNLNKSTETPGQLIEKITTEIKYEKNEEAIPIDVFIDEGEQTLQHVLNAVEQNNEQLAVKLIKKLNVKDETIFAKAVREGQENSVKELIENGVREGNSIDIAIYYRQLEILKSLINNGFNVSMRHLILSTKTEFQEAFELFVENGINPLELYKGETALHQIVTSYSDTRYQMLKFLVSKKYNLKVTNSTNETVLHKAVKVGDKNYEVIKLLLENGLSPDQIDNQGKTPRIIASDKRIKELLAEY